MVGPIRNKRANFHSIADLARSDSSPYSRVPELHAPANYPSHSFTTISVSPLKVSMEPAPAQYLHISSHSTPHRSSSEGGVHIPGAMSSSQSPTFSEDSGYGRDNSPTNSHQAHERSSDETQSAKRRKYRKQRTVFESAQLKTLEDTFAVNAYPSSEEYETLSDTTSIDESRLRIWFQNRRARFRKHAPQTVRPSIASLPAMPFHFQNYAMSSSNPGFNKFSHPHLMMFGDSFLYKGF